MSIGQARTGFASRRCDIIIDRVRPGLSEAGYNNATSVIRLVGLVVERPKVGTSGIASQFCKFGQFGNLVVKTLAPESA